MRVRGTLVAESLRAGAQLNVPMEVGRIRRVRAGDVAAAQPATWTLVELSVAAEDIDRLVGQLGEALEPGPWYADLASDNETVVVFAGRVVRYPRGDVAGRGEAEAHARAVGVPEGQIDWPV